MYRVGVVVAGIAAAGVVGAGTPAQASAKAPCAVGAWRLTDQNVVGKGVYQGRKYASTFRGATGVRMVIGAKTVTLDFNKSTRQYNTFTSEGTKGYEAYRGKLKAALKLTGKSEGTFVLAISTAKGDARARHVQTSPTRKNFGSYDVDKGMREFKDPKFGFDTLAHHRGRFTCTSKRFKLTRKIVNNERGHRYTVTLSYTYSRI